MSWGRGSSPDQAHFKQLELREKPGIEYSLVRHSALQRVLDVHAYAMSLPGAEKKSKKELTKLVYKLYGRLQTAEQSEKITENLIGNSLEVSCGSLLRWQRARSTASS